MDFQHHSLRRFPWGLLVGLILFALFLYAVFSPQDLSVRSEIQIQCPPEQVFEQIAQTEQWKNWFPWWDSATVILRYEAGEFGPQSKTWWDQKTHQIPSGKISFQKLEPNKGLEAAIWFGPTSRGALSHMQWSISTERNISTAQWTQKIRRGNPASNFFQGEVEQQLKLAMERGLTKLKAYCESIAVNRLQKDSP